MRTSRTIHIEAPPEKVWAAMVDVERWPGWASYMSSLRRQDDETFGMGSRVKVTPKALPGSVWTVTEFENGKSYTWETKLAPGVTMIGGHVVEPDGTATNATLWLEATGAVGTILSPILSLVFLRNTRLATQGLKKHCQA